MKASTDRAYEILEQYLFLKPRLAPIVVGHINETYRVEHASGRAILQRLSPIFSPLIHYPMDVVTTHLASIGETTPRLVRNIRGDLWSEDIAGGIWRVMTFIEGRTVIQPESATMCNSAGNLLGRFHRAVEHLDPDFSGARTGVHDTQRHVAGLLTALSENSSHPAYEAVAPLAEKTLQALKDLPDPLFLQPRIVHGDPKISNFIFDDRGFAKALIDLDTLTRMPAPLELGDAFRSWCNPGGEGDGITSFRLDFFNAGLKGYVAGSHGFLDKEEQALVPEMVELIILELTTRFLRDALEETYFGWDRVRFARASEHNLVRARSQWALWGAFTAVKSDAKRQAEAIFGAHSPV